MTTGTGILLRSSQIRYIWVGFTSLGNCGVASSPSMTKATN